MYYQLYYQLYYNPYSSSSLLVTASFYVQVKVTFYLILYYSKDHFHIKNLYFDLMQVKNYHEADLYNACRHRYTSVFVLHFAAVCNYYILARGQQKTKHTNVVSQQWKKTMQPQLLVDSYLHYSVSFTQNQPSICANFQSLHVPFACVLNGGMPGRLSRHTTIQDSFTSHPGV